MSTPRTPSQTRALDAEPQVDTRRLEHASVDDLIHIRGLLQATLRSRADRDLSAAMAERRCIQGPVCIPEQLEVVRAAKAEVDQRIAQVRADLKAELSADYARSMAQLRDDLMAERRARSLALARTELPQVGVDHPDFFELLLEWRRLERLMQLATPPEDVIPGFHPGASFEDLPPTREALDALWDAVVIDPAQMPGRIGLIDGDAYENRRADRLKDAAAQADNLVEMFRTARNLPTSRTPLSRVLVLEDGALLVTRRDYRADGTPRMVATRFDDALRAERSTTHVRDGVRQEAREEAFPWSVELESLRGELLGWKRLQKAEKQELGQRCVAFLNGVAADLGSPRRAQLAKITDTLQRIRTLTSNPGALLASTVGTAEVFRELAAINESRSLTVTAEQESLAAINAHFAEQRDAAFRTVHRLMNRVNLAEASEASIAAQLESVRSTMACREEVDVQPYIDMRDDVSALVQHGLDLLAQPRSDARADALRRLTIGLYATLKHSKLHAFFERNIATLTEQDPSEEGVSRAELQGARAQRKIDAVVRRLREYLAYRNDADAQRAVGIPEATAKVLPTVYQVDRAPRGTIELLISDAEHTVTSPQYRLKKLKKGLVQLDPLARYYRVAHAVRTDLGVGDDEETE